MGMLGWTLGTSCRARHEQPCTTETLIGVSQLAFKKDNASTLCIHLLMCVLSTLRNEQMSCKYTVKRLVYKYLSETVNGNRSVSSSYYIQLSLQAYSELMNCIYISIQKTDNIAVNYKGLRSFGPLRWLPGFMSRRILLWLLHVPYAVILKHYACHPHSVFVTFVWVSE